MINDQIEVYDGFKALFDEEKNVYIFKAPWLGRDIEIWLSSGAYEDEEDMKCLLEKFEQFWTQKETYLSKGQIDIKEKLLPYIATHENPIGFPYPKVSADDFDADYWLTSVYIIADKYGADAQLNFNKEDDYLGDDQLSVVQDMNGDYVSFQAAFDTITVD